MQLAVRGWPSYHLLRVQCSVKSGAGQSQVFNLFLGKGDKKFKKRRRQPRRVISWAHHVWEAVSCSRSSIRAHVMSLAGTEQKCWERGERERGECTRVREREVQQKMRHSQKTKAALQPVKNNCVSIPISEPQCYNSDKINSRISFTLELYHKHCCRAHQLLIFLYYLFKM